MRHGLSILALGVAALVVQGTAASYLPSHWIPDGGLLLVVYAGLTLGPAGGSLVAVTLGFTTDLLSGALLGQHALVRLIVLLVTRAADRRLHLRRTLPLGVFAFGATIGAGGGLYALSGLFEGWGEPSAGLAVSLAVHAVVNALAAPPLLAAAHALTHPERDRARPAFFGSQQGAMSRRTG